MIRLLPTAIGTAVLDRSRSDRYGFAMLARANAAAGSGQARHSLGDLCLGEGGCWRGGRVAEGGGLLNRYTV
jgi:hypothetical protein